MNIGNVFIMVIESSVFGVLFGVFVTVFALGRFAFAVHVDDSEMVVEKALWGFTCLVVFFLSMVPFVLVARSLWGTVF